MKVAGQPRRGARNAWRGLTRWSGRRGQARRAARRAWGLRRL